MPVLVLTSSLLDLVMIFAFQRFVHPWRRILVKVIINDTFPFSSISYPYQKTDKAGDASEMMVLRSNEVRVVPFPYLKVALMICSEW